MTTPEPPTPDRHFLIRQRLKIEAFLRHLDLDLHFHDGQLWIRSVFGYLPVVLRELRSDGLAQPRLGIELSQDLGTCVQPSAELLGFIDDINARHEPGIYLHLDERTAALRLSWRRWFEHEVDCSAVGDGLAQFGLTFAELEAELRERFFIPPAEGAAAHGALLAS